MTLTKRQFRNIASGLLAAAALAGQTAPPATTETRPYGVYLQTDEGWKKLEQVTKTGIVARSGFPGTGSSGFIYDGSQAALKVGTRPVFRVETAGDPVAAYSANLGRGDFIIVVMTKKKDHREVAMAHATVTPFRMTMRTGNDAKSIMPITRTDVEGGAYTLTPKEDLRPGQYLLTYRGYAGGMGYEFEVK